MHDSVLTMLAEISLLNNSARDRHDAATELERQADELEKKIWEMPANTLAGILAQLGFLRDYVEPPGEKLLDTIVDGLARLANWPEPSP
jgi:hypothetical protein